MKKTYSTPLVFVATIEVEGMIAASSFDVDASKSGNVQLSDKKGWDSNMWSSMEEEN